MFIYVPRTQRPVSEEERKNCAGIYGVIGVASAVWMLLLLVILFRGPANIQTFWTGTTLYIKAPSPSPGLVISHLYYASEDGDVTAAVPLSKSVLPMHNSAQALSPQQLSHLTWRTRYGVVVRPPKPAERVLAFYHYENYSN